MAEKSLVNEDADREPGPPAPEVVVPPLVLLDEPPQAATNPVVVTKATDTTANRFKETFIVPPCSGHV
jgi:hypothetical protein